MRVASVSEAKNKLSSLLDQVKGGETIVIAERGKPVARLIPVPPSDGDARLVRLEREGLIRRGGGDARKVVDIASPVPRSGGGTAAVDAIVDERRHGR